MIELQSPSSLCVMPTASGHNVLLTATDFDLYHLHVTRFFTHHRPEGQMESELVQRLADTEWRINRISRLEMAIYAQGQLEFADLFSGQDPNVQSILIEAHIHKIYNRQLKELSIQESRLRRYFEKDTAVLANLQANRQQEQTAELPEPTVPLAPTTKTGTTQRPNGLEFPTSPHRISASVKHSAAPLSSNSLDLPDR